MEIDIVNVTLVRKDNTLVIINKNSERIRLKEVTDNKIIKSAIGKEDNNKDNDKKR